VKYVVYIPQLSDDQMAAALYFSIIALVVLSLFRLARMPAARMFTPAKTNLNRLIERRPYMTPAECRLFPWIREGAGGAYHVVLQAPFSGFATQRRGLPGWLVLRVRGLFNTKRTDFALLNVRTGFVEWVIEVDGWTHLSPMQTAADALRDRIAFAAGVRTIRVPANISKGELAQRLHVIHYRKI
jgi:hypothetical protein